MVEKIKKLLIAGDSFAAKWPGASNGWVNLLEADFLVTNIAQPGISEYKILKQIEQINLNLFDLVIVSHTSPSRIHTPNHPLHTEGFHHACDLIASDLDGHFNPFNSSLTAAKMFFKYHYDEVYQQDIYNLMRSKINSLINIPYISLSHVPIANDLRIESRHIDFSNLWMKERGLVNHYTTTGNKLIYNDLKTAINE